VISNGSPEADAALPRLLASLRDAGLHTRRSYKATKNIGKLLKEAADAAGGARFAAILENGLEATLKDLTSGSQERVPIDGLSQRITKTT
jgi:histidyl-tRNA synthetase